MMVGWWWSGGGMVEYYGGMMVERWMCVCVFFSSYFTFFEYLLLCSFQGTFCRWFWLLVVVWLSLLITS